LNRNSNYNQNHQEKLLKIRKLEIFFSVEAARLRFWPAAGSRTPSWAFGPTANDRAAKPARLGLPSFPSRAASRPTWIQPLPGRRILIRRPSVFPAGTKNPATGPPRETLGRFSPPFFLHDGVVGHGDDGHGDRGGGVAGAAIDPLAGARAPPKRERAAVEWLGGGAPSPRALVPPASRTTSGGAPLGRALASGGAGLFRAAVAGGVGGGR